MTRSIIKIIDATVAAARLYAATRRIPECRHIAKELRYSADTAASADEWKCFMDSADDYDAQADSLDAAMGERADA